MSNNIQIEINEKKIIKEGWLEKQSRHLKRWRKRWVVLQDSTLYCFKKEKKYNTQPTEIINLKVFSSVKSSEDFTHRRNSFDVYSADMVFSMVAPNEQQKEGAPVYTRDISCLLQSRMFIMHVLCCYADALTAVV